MPSHASPSVLAHLSFEAPDDMSVISRNPRHHRLAMQGVLWKRRDIFKNRWRPRWFVLHPDQHILTYYLLNDDYNGSSINNNTTTTTVSGAAAALNGNGNNNNAGAGNRRRTYSDTSNVSENTVDYDVVPRGTIYLLNCTVEANEALTRPEEQLYALTITDHENAVHVHLGARTLAVRQRWIDRMRHVATPSPPAPSPSLPSPSNPKPSSTSISSPSSQQLQGQVTRDANPATSSSVAYSTIPEGSPAQESNPTKKDKKKNHIHWKTVETPKLTENVPIELMEKVDELLERHLPDVMTHDQLDGSDNDNDDNWIFRYDTDGIHFSTHATKNMVRSIRMETHHIPLDYLELAWVDPGRALEFATNLSSQYRMHSYSPHSALLYTAYHRVWPTSPRDFCSFVHWRLLEEADDEDGDNDNDDETNDNETESESGSTNRKSAGDDASQETQRQQNTDPSKRIKEKPKSLVMIGFSCSQASDMKTLPPRHVRGTLHISMSVWRPHPNDKSICSHTRILSYDLNGTIPSQLIQTIMQQQAAMPRVTDMYLLKCKNAEENYQPKVAWEGISYEKIYKVLDEAAAKSKKQGVDDDSKVSAVNDMNDPDLTNSDAMPSIVLNSKKQKMQLPLGTISMPLWKESVILLSPVILYRVMSIVSLFRFVASVFFCFAAAWAVSFVVLQHLLQNFGFRMVPPLALLPDNIEAGDSSEDDAAAISGRNFSTNSSTSCRFTVDLKGVLRFLANEHEAKEQLLSGSTTTSTSAANGKQAELRVTHIVIRALARAMAQHPQLLARDISPFLPPIYNLDLVLYEAAKRKSSQISHQTTSGDADAATTSGSKRSPTIICKRISNADEKSIQEIANELSTSNRQQNEPPSSASSTSWSFAPSCRLWTTPDHTEHSQVDMEWSPNTNAGLDWCPVAVVISGVRLEAAKKSATSVVGTSSSNGTGGNDVKKVSEQKQQQLLLQLQQRPHLSVTITIQSSNVELCRSFAEQLQQLIQFPEMCED